MASPVQASGGHAAHELDLVSTLTSVDFLAKVFNFAIVLTILVLAARKPLMRFLQTRQKHVEDGLAEAARRQAEADEMHAEYKARLKKLNHELERTRYNMERAGEAERARILKEAEANAERVRRDTQAMIEQQLNALRAEITREVVNKATDAAESIVREKIAGEDQTKLAERYLRAVQQLQSQPTSSGSVSKKTEGKPS